MPDMIRTVLVEQKMIYEERIAQLIRERDDLRREICELSSTLNGAENGLSCPQMIAVERNWPDLYGDQKDFEETNDG